MTQPNFKEIEAKWRELEPLEKCIVMFSRKYYFLNRLTVAVKTLSKREKQYLLFRGIHIQNAIYFVITETKCNTKRSNMYRSISGETFFICEQKQKAEKRKLTKQEVTQTKTLMAGTINMITQKAQKTIKEIKNELSEQNK